MEVEAWIQMGSERRETTFDVTHAEIFAIEPERLLFYVQDTVLDWIQCRYGWGWGCHLFKHDYGHLEDSGCARFIQTDDVLNPRTVRVPRQVPDGDSVTGVAQPIRAPSRHGPVLYVGPSEMESMVVEAWIQMGRERRDVAFEVTTQELLAIEPERLEFHIQDTVLDWLRYQYGWGWKCDLFADEHHLEEGGFTRFLQTQDLLIPRTVRTLLAPDTDSLDSDEVEQA